MFFINIKVTAESLSSGVAKHVLISFFFVTVYIVLLACSIKNFSGGRWCGDWIEHYGRAQFILGNLPFDYKFLDVYSFTSRPPLANAFYAFFLNFIGNDFFVFQLVATLANVFIFFPLSLILLQVVSPGASSARVYLLAILLMANPMFAFNCVYTWTKLFAGIFIVQGIYFFLKANYKWKNLFCFTFLAFSLLVHYSAGPYILAALALYMWDIIPAIRQKQYKEALLEFSWIGFASLAVLSVWFPWSLATYGLTDTFLSNTTATSAEIHNFYQNFIILFKNIAFTIFPHPFFGVENSYSYTLGSEVAVYDFSLSKGLLKNIFDFSIENLPSLSRCRDYFFLIYQSTFLASIGSVTSLFLILCFFRKNNRIVYRRQWLVFVGVTLFFGILVNPYECMYGVAHVCLQPLVLLMLVLAAGMPLGRLSAALLFLGCVVDYFLGLFLHFLILSFSPVRIMETAQAAGLSLVDLMSSIGPVFVTNFLEKQHLNLHFVGDSFPSFPFFIPSIFFAVFLIAAWFATKSDP